MERLSGGYRADRVTAKPFCTDDPEVLERASAVVLTIKSTGLDAAIPVLEERLPVSVPILCLLNGISPAERLVAALPEHEVIPGMVPYNVVWENDTTLIRNSIGSLTLADTPFTRTLVQEVGDIVLSKDMQGVRWGKLLLNLNNPINALSGRDLHTELSDRGYRKIFAATLSEALGILSRAGIKPAQIGSVPPERAVRALGLPNIVFNTLVLHKQGIRPGAQTSMAQDLAAGRRSEIDTLNGDVVRLADRVGLRAPVNAGLVRLMHLAEAEGRRSYSAAELAQALRL
jgi:2-dehydropantoate 2-reductase